MAAILVHFACGHETFDLAPSKEVDSGLHAVSGTGADSSPSAMPEVVCRSDDDCLSVGGVCATDKGRCVECTEIADCPLPWAAFCDPGINECVQCIDSTHCPMFSGWQLSCDPQLHQCVLPCATSIDCVNPVPICDQSRGACIQCETDANCANQPFGGSIVLVCSNGACVECVDNSDCPFATPLCRQDGRCVECFRSEQCGFGFECSFEGRCRSRM